MPTQNEAAAHSSYVLYQTLPEDSKRLLLQGFISEQAEILTLSLNGSICDVTNN